VLVGAFTARPCQPRVLALFVITDRDFSSPVDISLRLFNALVFTSLVLGSSPSSPLAGCSLHGRSVVAQPIFSY
jgi:hypothetical protein